MNAVLEMSAALACTALVFGCAAKESPSPLMAAAAATETAPDPGAITESSVVSTAAIVEAIDQKTRVVTLRTPDGHLHTITVAPSVRDLSKVRKGDDVVATYYESIAVEVKRPGEAKPGVSESADVKHTLPGQLPAEAVAETTTVVATVVRIDRKHQTVGLRAANGALTTVDVQNPAHLTKVKVGDLVEVSVTQALAIQVEKARKRR